MKYIIEQEIAQLILDYLAQRPFKEVASLIFKIQEMKPFDAEVLARNQENGIIGKDIKG